MLRIATVSVTALFYFVSAVLLLHILRTEINPTQHFLSEYALGRLGQLMTSALVGFGVQLQKTHYVSPYSISVVL